MSNKTILVTGGAGYVGSVLVPALLESNYHVKCLDRFFFGDDYLLSLKNDNLQLIYDDIRWFDGKLLDDVDVVLDLAALSNDPVGELNPEKTFEINHQGRSRVARLSKEHSVPRYILASSASVYGQQSSIADESATINPLTAYSKANRMAEIDTLSLNDESFSTTVLRFSSIYGISPRMRFDLAVNSIILDLFNSGKIIIYGKENRRPFLHIKDAIEAYLLTIQSHSSKISGEIFNVGSDDQNYCIYDLAKLVGDSISENYDFEAKDTSDNRSYFASFQKILKVLGFKPQFSVEDASKEIYDALKTKKIVFTKKMITVKWYNHILNNPDLLQKLSINNKIL
ncbi:NAD-dependent epimerase/dehydratase family protein [Nitrosopumilus ureiphilus]|uniref:NAD(P)-dependent oxidoreductase n=1 Tax=Nitrosopumilus ureiphilus TaxID=1470067 RepID=A0A7D5R8W5_9ARCH|nr:SDR family oxidoreductase [Nitrosopumilus ureiphilus]QLH07839.1 NAD(P)-dependent oxidoreductase [Nitrosopumilus ureiphilus]